MEVMKVRDLNIIKIDKKPMVVAYDSGGSVGMKYGSLLKVRPFYWVNILRGWLS